MEYVTAHILRNWDVYVTIMFNCNYDEEQIVNTITEKQLNKQIINVRESKYASIQPEYQSCLLVFFFQNNNVPLSNNIA